MIDRWGKPVMVAWAEHEILWVKAAITLPRDERTIAFRDIATMTGRTEFAIREKAVSIRAKQRADAAILASLAMPRRVMLPARVCVRGHSQIKPPTKAQLMGCR